MPETLTDALLGRLIDGRYEVRERVASGGMATVYLALDRRLERMVAVKVMHSSLGAGGDLQEFAARFRREAKAAARLTHPGMVRVYDQGTDGDISYLTMEYVHGENLRSRLSHESTLPVGEAFAIVEAVLDALAAAHRQGLVHRDVKPENVLIDEDGTPKLADFGLARAVTEVTSTSTGTLLGTVAYLAPELVQRGHADPRSDVYASGIVLFEMVTGRKPFAGGSPLEVASRHVNEDVPAPSTYVPWLPAEVDALVARMTARDPSLRPADATAALASLRQTRSMIDEPTLDRRADPPSGTIPISNDETAVLDATPTGSTMALPIGLGLVTLPRGPLELAEDDPEATEPARPRKPVALWIVALIAALVALGGLGAWWYATQGPGAYTNVPPVAGETQADAVSILTTAGLDPLIRTAYDNEVPEGYVVSTNPEAQAQIAKGGDVTVIVSLGPRMEVVPAVLGIPKDDAITQLEDAGFTIGEVEDRYDDLVPQGIVMATNPAADENVRWDTPIDMVVSNGPAPITIPDIIGLDEARATALLVNVEDYALQVIVVYERTVEVDKGEVFKTDPAPGAESTRTATITIYVSEGKPFVEMPLVFGMEADKAEEKLTDLGLVVEWRKQFPFSTKKNVSDQDPEQGTMVEVGSTVVLYYSG